MAYPRFVAILTECLANNTIVFSRLFDPQSKIEMYALAQLDSTERVLNNGKSFSNLGTDQGISFVVPLKPGCTDRFGSCDRPPQERLVM